MTSIYIPFYFEWMDFIRALPDEEYGRLIKSIFDYAKGYKRKKGRFSPDAEMAYKFITSAIKRCESKRCPTDVPGSLPEKKPKEKKVFKRVEHKETEEKAAVPTEETAAVAEKPTEAVEKREISTPTRDEVRNFFKSRGFRSNPDEFYNFYESNGWMVGQNRMQNWYSSAENWELRTQKEETAAKPTDEPRRYGDFDIHEAFKLALERSYSDIDDDDDDDESSYGSALSASGTCSQTTILPSSS